jgi:helix-turn-helix, Psq domain/Tc5 transposase DNA-binding domain
MPEQSKEAKILLAIEALRVNPKLKVRKAANIYDVPGTTLRSRMAGTTSRAETQSKNRLLDELEEKVLLQYILDLDNRGFSPKLEAVEDIANHILASRKKQPVGKLWAHRFVQRNPELKTRFSRSYDFQRALCKDPKLIENWFQRVVSIKEKYEVQDCDI